MWLTYTRCIDNGLPIVITMQHVFMLEVVETCIYVEHGVGWHVGVVYHVYSQYVNGNYLLDCLSLDGASVTPLVIVSFLI